LRSGVKIPYKGDKELTKDVMLFALPRTVVGKKVKRIRREGWVPIVLYGPDFESEIFQANGFDTNRAVTAAGMTSLISLQVEGRQEPYKTLVRDVQRDLLTDALIHVDLYHVSMTQRITTEVPVELVGRTPLSAQGTVMLLTLMDRVEIECLPGDLVPSLELDVSQLQDLDDVLYVKDLSVPEGITIRSDADGTVVRLARTTRLEEEVKEEELLPEEVAADGVEVIARGKTEEDED
jgi:large subunit ribosomal protein L25